MTTGVVLMTYGAPTGAADVAAYLARVRGGAQPTPELVREFIGRYERIGWSPLGRITGDQAAALEARLGTGWRVRAGMRFSEPSVEAAVAGLGSVDRVVGIVLSPQRSPALMGGYDRALAEATAGRAVVAGAWYREPAYIEALAERTRARLRDDVPVVFTAHSLPRRVYDAEPGYIAQLRETAQLVATRLGLARWHWAYQSAGHTQEDWLRPDLTELFPLLVAEGAREVLVAPVQFVADHLEVLYDLDVAAAAQAERAGLRYGRIDMPNLQPAFIEALANVATRTAADPTPSVPSAGR